MKKCWFKLFWSGWIRVKVNSTPTSWRLLTAPCGGWKRYLSPAPQRTAAPPTLEGWSSTDRGFGHLFWWAGIRLLFSAPRGVAQSSPSATACRSPNCPSRCPRGSFPTHRWQRASPGRNSERYVYVRRGYHSVPITLLDRLNPHVGPDQAHNVQPPVRGRPSNPR
jgi:hypothetical protein